MSEVHIDRDQEKQFKIKLLTLDKKINDIIEALNKLQERQEENKDVRVAETYQTNQNLLKLVEYIKQVDTEQDKEGEEDFSKLKRNTEEVAQQLKKLIEKSAKEMMSYKVIKNKLDNEQDKNIALLGAEIAKERATTSHQRAGLENKIAVNKADMARQEVILKNMVNEESLKQNEENANLENELTKMKLRQKHLKDATDLVDKQMEKRARKMENRLKELEEIVEVLKKKNKLSS